MFEPDERLLRDISEAGYVLAPKSLSADMNAIGQKIMETGMRNVIGQPLPTLRNIYQAMMEHCEEKWRRSEAGDSTR